MCHRTEKHQNAEEDLAVLPDTKNSESEQVEPGVEPLPESFRERRDGPGGD